MRLEQVSLRQLPAVQRGEQGGVVREAAKHHGAAAKAVYDDDVGSAESEQLHADAPGVRVLLRRLLQGGRCSAIPPSISVVLCHNASGSYYGFWTLHFLCQGMNTFYFTFEHRND